MPFWLPASIGWSALAGGLLGFAMVQVGLIGHDAGHLAVLRGARANHALGQFCWSISLAVGYSYWHDRHSRHHARTNDANDDPDLGGLGLIAYTEDQAAARQGWRRVVVRYQDALAAFLLLFLAFSLRLESLVFALRKRRGGRRWAELGLLGAGGLLWLAPAASLGWRWIGIYLLSQVVASVYLSLVIAPNHYGMPIWPSGARLSFLERQVLSSRNTPPHPVWDFVFGGLNSQIEHHLFPTMPRPKLGSARAIVKPFCAARGLAYVEANPLRTFAEVLAAGHQIARTAEAPARRAAG